MLTKKISLYYSKNFSLELSNSKACIQQIPSLKNKFDSEKWDECFEMFLKDNGDKNELICRWIKLFKDKFVFDRETNPIYYSGNGSVANKWVSTIHFNEDCLFTFGLFCELIQMRMLK